GLAVSLSQKGVILGAREHRHSEALGLFKRSSALLQELLDEEAVDERECRFRLGLSLNNLANCLAQTQPREEADGYERALVQFERLHDRFPKEGRARDWLVRTRSNLALVLEGAGRSKEALGHHTRAVTDASRFVQQVQQAVRDVQQGARK